jgi:hypothetical protein
MRSRDSANKPAGYILKPILRRGYWGVSLGRDGKLHTRSVHRLVCRTFLGPAPTPNHIVCHGDGNPLNNHYLNLRWATHKDNQADRTKHGRRHYGQQSHFHKLTNAAVIDIRSRYIDGLSISVLSDIYGVSRGQISNIVNNKQQNGPLLMVIK